MIATWPAPGRAKAPVDELVVQFAPGRDHRILVLPALFDEANKLRRQTVRIMRRLDELGIDSFLPDFPGCNESLADLSLQSLESWAKAATVAVGHFGATHVLTVRAGSLIAPAGIPGWSYAPQSGPKVLRGMLRARVLAARENGQKEAADDLLDQGLADGLNLAGWNLGADMISQLQSHDMSKPNRLVTIAQKDLPGPGLWLRAEPDENAEQADAIAGFLASELLEE